MKTLADNQTSNSDRNNSTELYMANMINHHTKYCFSYTMNSSPAAIPCLIKGGIIRTCSRQPRNRKHVLEQRVFRNPRSCQDRHLNIAKTNIECDLTCRPNKCTSDNLTFPSGRCAQAPPAASDRYSKIRAQKINKRRSLRKHRRCKRCSPRNFPPPACSRSRVN